MCLSVAADIRIAASDAKIACNFVKLGMGPGLVYLRWRLHFSLSRGQDLESPIYYLKYLKPYQTISSWYRDCRQAAVSLNNYFQTGNSITGKEAEQKGFVHSAVGELSRSNEQGVIWWLLQIKAECQIMRWKSQEILLMLHQQVVSYCTNFDNGVNLII